MLYFNNQDKEEKPLEGLPVSSLSQDEQNQVKRMMTFLKVPERQLYIMSLELMRNSLELMRNEVESQIRMLDGIERLLKLVNKRGLSKQQDEKEV